MRNCAWLNGAEEESRRAVWARSGVISCHCPKSVITPQSMSWLEQFRIWKAFGGGTPWEREAKAAEAFLVLEKALEAETEHGKK